MSGSDIYLGSDIISRQRHPSIKSWLIPVYGCNTELSRIFRTIMDPILTQENWYCLTLFSNILVWFWPCNQEWRLWKLIFDLLGRPPGQTYCLTDLYQMIKSQIQDFKMLKCKLTLYNLKPIKIKLTKLDVSPNVSWLVDNSQILKFCFHTWITWL